MDSIKIKRLNEYAIIPHRATDGSAGMDLCACIQTPVTVEPHQLVTIPTGIAIALPNPNCVALLFGRSGLGVKHGITLSNSVGVIDSDYRGEIKVGLCNLSDTPYIIQPDERIAQLVITPVLPLPVQQVDELDETQRGENGFGSTGK